MQSQKKQENLGKKRKTKCFHVLQTFKGGNIFLLPAVLKGLVGPWCTFAVLPYRHLYPWAPSVWADDNVQHGKPKYCTASSCKIWSKESSSTRLILTRMLGKLCQTQQTALEWCLCLSAWYRCDFNVSISSMLNMWSIILLEIFKLPIKAKADTSIWSTNSHIRLISDFYPLSPKKSITKICLYRHLP